MTMTPTPADDHSLIHAVLLDYVESWYEGDGTRTERAVHPDLAKRIVEVDRGGRQFLEHMGALELVQNTRLGSGRNTPEADRLKHIEVFDVFGKVATAKVTAARWVDYVHLARLNDRWQIVNVVWAMK